MYNVRDEKFMFGILDGEYQLKACQSILLSETKRPIERYIKDIQEMESELYDEENPPDKKRRSDLEDDILEAYEHIDFDRLELLDVQKLFGMFLASMMKHKRENNVKYLITVFDKTPYYHKVAIENYKADRYNSTKAIEDINEKLKDKKLTETQRDILLLDKKLAEYDTENFWRYQKVKKSFIEEDQQKWVDCGMTCVSKRGYEADQLAYFIANKISQKHVKNKSINCILLSVDKDWHAFNQPGVVFQSIWTGPLRDRRYGNLTDEWEQFREAYVEFAHVQKLVKHYKDITHYDYGILKELFIQSHNNATLYDEIDDGFRDSLVEKYIDSDLPKREAKKKALYDANVELFFRIINGCKNKKFTAYNEIRNAYKAMNVWLGKTVNNGYCKNIGTKYSDDLEQIAMFALKNCNKYRRGTFLNMCEDKEISVNYQNYAKYVSDLEVRK